MEWRTTNFCSPAFVRQFLTVAHCTKPDPGWWLMVGRKSKKMDLKPRFSRILHAWSNAHYRLERSTVNVYAVNSLYAVLLTELYAANVITAIKLHWFFVLVFRYFRCRKLWMELTTTCLKYFDSVRFFSAGKKWPYAIGSWLLLLHFCK